MRHVDAEAVDAAIEPEPQDVAELGPDLLVRPVEVGLRGVEQVQVPLAVRHARPGRASEDRLPVVRRGVAVAVAEHVPRPLRGSRSGGERLLEPLVLVGGVVGNEIDDHPEPETVGAGEHRIEVVERAEERVDVAVVGHVVARVLLRGRHERRQPDDVDPEVAHRLQAARDARDVAHAVAGRVGEGAGVDLIDHGGTPPFVSHVRHRRARTNRMEALAICRSLVHP